MKLDGEDGQMEKSTSKNDFVVPHIHALHFVSEIRRHVRHAMVALG